MVACVYYIEFSKAYSFDTFISYHFLFLRLCAIFNLGKHLFLKKLFYSLEPIGLNSGSKVDVRVVYQKGLL